MGTVSNPENLNSMRQPIPIGGRDSVSLGEAIICSNVEGTKIQEFTIEIVEINQNSDCGKDIVFKVTDESLIQKTGGIVRGMSGSPIIQKRQNNRFCDTCLGQRADNGLRNFY